MRRWLRVGRTVVAVALTTAVIGVSLATPAQAVSIELPDLSSGEGPTSAIVLLLTLTVLAVAPALLLLTTSFTKIIVVLSLTRNALGLQGIPPNQVLAGLAIFLSFFVMSPVLGVVNTDALQPYLDGSITFGQAFDIGRIPLETFMLANTRPEELALMVQVSQEPPPATPSDVSLTTLVPAFILSELRAAFIIGFVIFLPFLIIDMVVSSGLMSVGMIMLPPVLVSLPFKLLLFVLVDGHGARRQLRVGAQMSEANVVELSTQLMWTAALLAAPILLTALIVGLAVSLFQGLTSLQDQTLSFVPKIIAVGIALVIAASWMVQTLLSFTSNVFDMLPDLLG